MASKNNNRLTTIPQTPPPRPQTAARKRTRDDHRRDAEALAKMMGDFPKELVDRFLRKGAAAGAELSPVKSIPLALIDPSPFQSREEFPEAEIRSLADSIAAVGLLSPLVVRPSPADPSRFELVAGERRKRALELLGESHADCSVRDLADVDAAEVALLENLDRENLNAAEASRGLQTLLRLGHDVSTLAALLRIGVDDVAARLQLAELPAFWQAWLRKERDPRRGVAAERLVAWLEFPDVLAAMEPVAARWGNGMTLSAWQRELVDVVLRLSRDMDPQSPVGPCFKVTRELREKLKVVQLRVGDHVEERSMAVELWDTHQDRGNAPPAKRRGSILGTPATNGRSEVGGQRSEVGDSDSPPGDQPLAIADQGPPDDPEKLERWVDGFLRETLHQHIVKMECSELYALAEHVRVDLKAEFKCTRWFTDVFGGKRLLALCDEWGIREEVADARDRGELIAAILALRSRCFLPQCVVDLCRPADADAAL